MNSQRIKAILADEDFTAVVDSVKHALVKQVMHKDTSDEQASELRAEYHAMDRVLRKLGSIARAKQE